MTLAGDSVNFFESKIKEAVALVPAMSPEEKLRCVHFWNNISGKLQDLVNASTFEHTEIMPKKNDKLVQHKVSGSPRNSECDNLFSVEYFNGSSSYVNCESTSDKLIHAQNENSPLVEASHSHNGISLNDLSCSKNSFDSEILEKCTSSELSNATDCSLTIKKTIELKSTKDSSILLLPVSDDSKSVSESYLLQLLTSASQDSDRELEFELENIHPVDVSVCSSDKESLSPVNKVNRLVTEWKETTPSDIVSTTDNSNFICDWCDQCFADIGSLNSHRKIHTKPFFCTECEAQFSCKGNLMVHFRKHTGEKPYPCSMCSAHFSTQGNLKRHLRSHMGLRPHKCSHCGSCFTEKKSLIVHMRRHTGERPYQCELCRKKFSQSGILQSHMAVHLNERSHLCEHCGKAFRQKSQLRIHMLRHEGVRKYSCKQCAARFLIKGDLERHERMHTGERPYVCELCHKSFTRQQSLKEHHNRHYGLKPFKCKHCSKTFPEMSACYKHMKQHEKIDTDTPSPTTEVANAKQVKSNTKLTDVQENSIHILPPENFTVILHDYNPKTENPSQFTIEADDVIPTS